MRGQSKFRDCFHWRPAEAEKRALVERFEKPSGVSDEERLKREMSEYR